MPTCQLLLFPDPRPLVDRLGAAFFRALPESAGVYLMRDKADAVLYVGKAKNLRKRLTHYRVANPDRMPRRHLRLLRAVERIEIEICADEAAALAREAELLMAIRPKFNRAGTWRGPAQFLVWRRVGNTLEFAVTNDPAEGWERLGPGGVMLRYLRAVLTRLLWRAVRDQAFTWEMPAGWVHDQFARVTRIDCTIAADDAIACLERLRAGDPVSLCEWVSTRCESVCHPFERIALAEDIESLKEMMRVKPRKMEDG